jgi:hypothetical protein
VSLVLSEISRRFIAWHRRSNAEAVSVVLTSCGRHDLLVRTLDSFFRFNTHPIAQFIVVEDGACVPQALSTYGFPCPTGLISTGERVGQIAAIDYAYSRVTTPYVFHLEDDWEFYASGFIEKSLTILDRDDTCLQVYLRALDDTNGHPIDPSEHRTRGVRWRRLKYGFVAYGGEWNGFSFNPGLRRLADYVAVGGYGVHGRDAPPGHAAVELALSRIYREKGMFAAILSDRRGEGYVRHIGWERTVLGHES